MSRFLSAEYAGLKPYTPGEQPQGRKFIKLNTNECPYPPAPAAREVAGGALNLYPDPECKPLIKAIAEVYGVKEACITVGNGSDELLAFAVAAFAESAAAFGRPFDKR